MTNRTSSIVSIRLKL